MNKWNHYTCETCGKVTIAFHEQEGVTPFIIRCYAGDSTEKGQRILNCKGQAQSNFFCGSQDDDQKPHVIFFRPGVLEAIEFINKEPESSRVWLLEHYSKGGSLMRVV